MNDYYALRLDVQPCCTDATDLLAYLLGEGQDWNAEWERNYFKPIVVGDRCVVHSSFHTDVPTAEFDIVIDPKMAFGTGHHATTSLILTRLLDMELSGRPLIDVGLNSHPEIAMLCGDAALLEALAPADVVVANINRNVILADIARYAAAMRPGATLLLSGFYEADCPMVEEAAIAAGLEPCGRTTRDSWACVELRKPE